MNTPDSGDSDHFLSVLSSRHEDYSVVGRQYLAYLQEVAVRDRAQKEAEVQHTVQRVLTSEELLPTVGVASSFRKAAFEDFMQISDEAAILLDPHDVQNAAQNFVLWLGDLSR